MKRILKIGIIGGLVFFFGDVTYKVIGGIIAVVCLILLVLIVVFLKHIFHRNKGIV
jgi:hypothetical protein